MESLSVIWEKFRTSVESKISKDDYEKWFLPIKPIKLKNNILTIQVPSQFFYEYIETNYVDILKDIISEILGINGKLEYAVLMSVQNKNNQRLVVNLPSQESSNTFNHKNLNNKISVQNPFVIPGIKRKIDIDPNLNINLSFENFIEGDCNRLARATGLAVSENPGKTSFNPFIVYGDAGLGKTHLANAIGIKIKKLYPEKNVLYVSSEKFTQQFIDASRNNSYNEFLMFYQNLDVLIMDDIHFLEGKEKTQEIYFHIFNHLHFTGKQIIVTCDKKPSEVKGLEKRLITRFQMGLTTDLQYPNLETRMAILKQKAYLEGINLSDDVVEFIANSVNSNIRQLEGFLISLFARSMVDRVPIDLRLAEEVAQKSSNKRRDHFTIDEIKNIICDYFKISSDMLKSSTRKREVVQARQLAMYFSKKFSHEPLLKIGINIGRRNHATVLHSCNVVKDLMEIDKSFKKMVDEIENSILREN